VKNATRADPDVHAAMLSTSSDGLLLIFNTNLGFLSELGMSSIGSI
jgi:hypothetical protein